MGRWTRMLAMAMLIFFGLTARAHATTYYIAANGSDSNNGTSKASPWLHAPGMSTCTATCATVTLTGGDSLIFRGGDTWHFGNSALTPFAGFLNGAWNMQTWSGTAATCQLNPSAGTVVTTGCIYIGVDKTWYSGASWTRPILNMDNPLSTSDPASCAYDDGNKNMVFIPQYAIFDDFELVGWCWNTTTTQGNVVNGFQGHAEIKNVYAHGWTMGATAAGCGACDSDEYSAFGMAYSIGNYSRSDHNVIDGSDSTHFTAGSQPYNTGQGGSAGEIDHNVFNYVSNVVKYAQLLSVHDNLFENMYEPLVTGTHGNVIEMAPTDYTTSTYYYNNVILATNIGETIDWFAGAAASSKYAYFFNNVMVGPNGNASNCWLVEANSSNPSGTFEFFNNTDDSPCGYRELGGATTSAFQNNHFIGYSTSGAISNFANVTTAKDNGNEVWQSETTANLQGYTRSNNYAPSSTTGATYHAGADLSSICDGMDNSEAAAACLNGIAGVSYNSTDHTVTDKVATPRGTMWDAGAYQFGGQTSSQPNAPSGLVAAIQ